MKKRMVIALLAVSFAAGTSFAADCQPHHYSSPTVRVLFFQSNGLASILE